MKTFNILDRSLPIFGKHLVEASAGTGKTFAIEHLCLRLILSDVPIDQILVMTFTKAATRELKMRIRSQLQTALECSVKGETNDCPDYLHAALENKEQLIKKLQDALSLFDENHIYTIHGFCSRMLTDFGFEAGCDYQTGVESSYHGRCREALFAFFRNDLSNLIFPSQMEIVLKKVLHDIERLLEQIETIASSHSVIELPAYFDNPQNSLDTILEELPSVQFDLFMEDFERLRVCYKGTGNQATEKEIALLGAILEGKQDLFNHLIRTEMKCFKRFDSDNLKVKAKLPPQNTLHYPDLFEKLRTRLYPFIFSLSRPKMIILYCAREFRKQWKKIMEEESIFSLDGILSTMHGCIATPAFVHKVQSQYQAVIIDEFQDTDSQQWEIFKTLFLNDNPRIKLVCLVGDPKQSIYGFRNADLYTYLSAVDNLGMENKSFLDTNYRSESALVEGLNALFSTQAAQGWLTLPSLNKTLDYIPVKHRGKDQFPTINDGKEALHFFTLHDSKELYPWIGDEIIDLTNQGIKTGSIAILVKDRYQARELQSYLKTRKIASTMKQTQHLALASEFASIETLLRAVIHPDDESLLKEALATPLIGFNHHQLKEKSSYLEGKKALLHLSQLFFEQGIAHFFSHFLETPFLHGQTVLHRLLAKKDLRSYQIVMQTIDLLLEQSASEKEHILFLIDELKTLDLEENEKLKIQSTLSSNQITIMTIHTSKGLEFEVVFALGLISRHEKEEEIVAVKKGTQKILRFHDREDPDSILADQERSAETMRLLYVAMTRAKRRLYVPYLFDKDQQTDEEKFLSPIELFFHKKLGNCSEGAVLSYLQSSAHPKISCSVDHIPKNTEMDEEHKIEIIPPPSFSFNYPTKSIESFSSIKTDESIQPVIEMIQSTEKTPYTLPRGAETGSKIHAIIETYLKNRKDLSQIIHEIIAYSPLEDWEEVIHLMIQNLFSHRFTDGDCSFSLFDIEPTRMIPEMEFFYDEKTHLVKGYIDLVVEHGGKYYFLDWKTNSLGEDYSTAVLEQAMQHNNYDLQGKLYSTALIKYISQFDDRSPEEWFGGGFFVFLRGMGVYRSLEEVTI